MYDHQLPTVDPDNVPETLCLGPFNITTHGQLVTIVFTHGRPKTKPLIANGVLDYECVVRARIVTSFDNLLQLRDAVDRLVHQAADVKTAPVSDSQN